MKKNLFYINLFIFFLSINVSSNEVSPIKMDLEWSHTTRSQCFTRSEFEKMIQRQAGQQPGGKPPTE